MKIRRTGDFIVFGLLPYLVFAAFLSLNYVKSLNSPEANSFALENSLSWVMSPVVSDEDLTIDPTVEIVNITTDEQKVELASMNKTEQIILNEPTKKPTVETQTPITGQPLTTTAPNVTNSPQIISDFIEILGKKINIFQSNHTLTDSGDLVARYGDKFLYGHNVPNVFGNLKTLQIGDTFKVMFDGHQKTYRIKIKEVMIKDRVSDFMWAITQARFMGEQYGLSIMTCEGEPRPNRDATHRLLLFADPIS